MSTPYASGRVATDPITGQAKRETLRDLAAEHGWDYKAQDHAWEFRKDGRILYVPLYAGRMALNGVLHEPNQGGVRVMSDSHHDVLTGTVCICDPDNLDDAYFVIHNPDCEVKHS